MNRTTVHLSDGQLRAVDEIVSKSKRTEDVPEFSQSETIRRLIDDGLEVNDDLLDLLDEETRVLIERSNMLDKEAKVRNLRTGFETRVKQNFKQRFENGYDSEQLQEFAINMRREAELLWPEWSEEDYSDRRAEALDYVDAVVDAAIDAVESSEFDPLDPESIFDQYDGVESGRRRERAVEQKLDDDLLDDAVRLLEKGSKPANYSSTQEPREPLSPDAVVGRLSARTDVSEEQAEQIVLAAIRRSSLDMNLETDLPGGVGADD